MITIRDPFEVVSSFCNVKRRQGAVINAKLTQVLAKNAAIDYERAVNFKANNPDRVLLFHYDSLFDDTYGEKLAAFNPDIQCNPDRVWDSKFVSKAAKKRTPWVTEKYGKKLDGVEKPRLI